jgi:methylthioribulose-1-phosphate dehydratase
MSSADVTLATAIQGLIAAGKWMSQRGHLPATSGNLSCRVSPTRAAITASGGDKGDLREADLLVVDIGDVADAPPAGASAETPLHLSLYRDRPECGAVLHGHSLVATLLSQARADQDAILLSGYELLKAFAGVRSHETAVEIPMFANSQDMNELAGRVAARLADRRAGAPPAHCYLLVGHGYYAWGQTLAEARRHVEALDFLLTCEWEKSRTRP